MENYESSIAKYYPADIYPHLDMYDITTQSVLRIKKIISAKRNHKQRFSVLYNALIDIISESNYNLFDETKYYMGDRCITYTLRDKSIFHVPTSSRQERYITICLSVLEKFYCIYEKKLDIFYEKEVFLAQLTADIGDNFSDQEQKLLEMLENTICQYGYKKIPFPLLYNVFERYKAFGKDDFTLFYGLFKDDF